MSPTASLAHYKSNLDPPPVYSSGVASLDMAPQHLNADTPQNVGLPVSTTHISASRLRLDDWFSRWALLVPPSEHP